MTRRAPAFVLALLSAFLAHPGDAVAGLGTDWSGCQTIVIQQDLNGYDQVTDGTISSNQPTVNFGAGDTLKVSGPGWTGYHPGQHKALIKFNIPVALKTNTLVVEAYLWIYQCLGYNAGAIESLDVRRVGIPWVEGTGGNGAGAVQANTLTWNNAGALAWNTAGCNLMGIATPAQVARGQWGSWNFAGITGDSALVPVMAGTDTMFNGVGSAFPFDAASDVIGTTTLKCGTGGDMRQGWVCIPVQPQIWRWQTGKNEDDGFILSLHNTTVNRMYGFYSRNYADRPYGPKLVMRIANVTSTTAPGTGTVGGRGGASGGGVGGRG